MLRLIANDKRPAILNAFAFAMLYMLAFLVIMLPFVLIAISNDGGALDDAEAAVYMNKSEVYRLIDQILTFIPFLVLGGYTEIMRRSISGARANKSKEEVAKACIPVDVYTAVGIFVWIALKVLSIFV